MHRPWRGAEAHVRLICGYVQLDDRPADSSTLERMCESLGSRGLRAAVSQRVDGAAAIAVLDFAATALAGPLPVSAGGIWLAADARLDDVDPRGDASATLDAFEREGADLPAHLDGDYALAFWTPRQKQLILARDIMGARPLCYLHVPGKLLAFASLPRGIHSAKIADTPLDLLALGTAQVRCVMPPDRTGWRGVSWLLAGQTLTASPTGVHLHSSWRPEPARVGTWRGSADDAAAELLHHIDRAVTVRLRGSGPVASHLSGGLDSSGISVLAGRKLRDEGRRLHAWSILTHPSEPVFSEAPWVEEVLAAEPYIDWTPVYVPRDRPLGGDNGDPDLPTEGGFETLDRQIVSGVAAQGASLLMSGISGDEGASYVGHHTYFDLLRQGELLHALRETRARARLDQKPLYRQIAGSLISPMLPDMVRRAIGHVRAQRPMDLLASRASSFLRPAFRDLILAELSHFADGRNSPEDRIRLLTEGLDDRANRWATIGARHGVALTYPLADRRLLEFCLSLPLVRLLDGGYARQPYRNAMRGILPEKVRLRRNKTGNAGMTLAMHGRHYAALLPSVDALRGERGVKDLFDFDAVQDALSSAIRITAGPLSKVGYLQELPPWFFLAIHANRALTLAQHIVRFEPDHTKDRGSYDPPFEAGVSGQKVSGAQVAPA